MCPFTFFSHDNLVFCLFINTCNITCADSLKHLKYTSICYLFWVTRCVVLYFHVHVWGGRDPCIAIDNLNLYKIQYLHNI